MEEHTMSILKVENLSYDYVTKAGLVHAVKEATAEFEDTASW